MSGPNQEEDNELTVRTAASHIPVDEQLSVGMAVDPIVGTRLAGRYMVLERLGSGGMAVVYKARQEMMDRIVAIKTLKVGLLTDPVILKRFEREAKALAKLNHANIVTVFDAIVTPQGQPYFVMDYLSGKSLADLLREKGAIPVERAQHIILQVCDALNHAHHKEIVHRDLKPANIMIEDGQNGTDLIKVVDFGLAKIGEDAQRLTQTGEVWGSPLYMSPEQCQGKDLDARSDIYSFGVVMYHTLTGRVPFEGTSFIDTMNKHLNDSPPPFSRVRPDLSNCELIERCIMRALEKDPDKRYQTVSELKTDLLAALPASVVTTRETPARMTAPQTARQGRGGGATGKQERKATGGRKAEKRAGKAALLIGAVFLLIGSGAVVSLLTMNRTSPSIVPPMEEKKGAEKVPAGEDMAAPAARKAPAMQTAPVDPARRNAEAKGNPALNINKISPDPSTVSTAASKNKSRSNRSATRRQPQKSRTAFDSDEYLIERRHKQKDDQSVYYNSTR